jgi:hypothetical protein
MNYDRKLHAQVEAPTYTPIIAPEIEERLHTLLNALERMDTRTAQELEWLDKSSAEEVRRLPLQEAAEELRAQHRATFSDLST